MKKVIVLTGGGSAGHVIPNIALLPTLSKNFNEIHYIGSKDDVIPSKLVYDFVDDENLVKVVNGATHNSGFEVIYPLIWKE